MTTADVLNKAETLAAEHLSVRDCTVSYVLKPITAITAS